MISTTLAKRYAKALVEIGSERNALEKYGEDLSALTGLMETSKEFTVHACTDISGFGLLGHLLEMSRGSEVNVMIDLNAVPIIPGTAKLATQGMIPGGSKANLEHVSEFLRTGSRVSDLNMLILADAQTSGGLLFAIPMGEATSFLTRLHQDGVADARIIGSVKKPGRGDIEIIKDETNH